MESKHFDRLVKSFVSDTSRRGMLRGVTAAAVGALGLGLARPVAARPECTTNADCASQCPAGNPCAQPICVKGNSGIGGGGNFCDCADPCPDSRPNCTPVNKRGVLVARCTKR